MAKALNIIVVGKFKDSHLESIEEEFLKRINSPEVIIYELKSSSENKHFEGEVLIKKIKELSLSSSAHVIALSEWGKKRNSVEFSKWLESLIEKPQKIIFLIAGAEGFSEEVLKLCHERISLSELTFPHKLARILLVEQLYRAQTIRSGHPYHN
jgi:23S rRNA (pseudouridine1915-N3)-methyltransferase